MNNNNTHNNNNVRTTRRAAARQRQALLDRRLYVAAFSRPARLAAVQDALSHGANPNVDLLDYGATAVDAASLQADAALMRALIAAGADVNHVGRDGFTALHRAVLTANLAMATLLVNTPATPPLNINAKTAGRQTSTGTTTTTTTDHNALTALQILFTRGGTPQMAQLLIDAGADASVRDANSGESLAHVARTPALLAVLREHDVDLDEPARNDGFTPLHYAAIKGNLATVQYLVLEGRARVHHRSHQGYAALHYAAHKGHLAVIEWLCEHGGTDPRNVNETGNSAFHVACTVKHTHVVRYFLDQHGFAATDVAEATGLLPLHYACLSTRAAAGGGGSDGDDTDGTDLVRLLLSRQGPLDRASPVISLLLHLAADWSAGLCQLLVQEHGLDVSAVHKERTVLHRAARQGTVETLECLTKMCLEHEAENRRNNIFSFSLLNARDGHGWTALHAAVAKRDVGKVTCLLEAGCAVDVRDMYGRTPLHVAVHRVPLPISERPRPEDYYDRRSSLSVLTSDGWSTYLAILKLLLQRGADPTEHDIGGRMALAVPNNNRANTTDDQNKSLSMIWEMVRTGPSLRLFATSSAADKDVLHARKRPRHQAAAAAKKRLKVSRC